MTPNAVATPTPVQPQTQPPAAAPALKAEGKYTTGAPAASATPTLRTEVAAPGCGAPSADRSLPLSDETKPVEPVKA